MDTKMSARIVTELADRILRVAIDRPEAKNALSVAMYRDLADALARAASDPAVRVVLLHGHPQVFTSGKRQSRTSWTLRAHSRRTARHEIPPRDHTAEKPIVAAVNGPAIGIGTTMLLHCDFVYAGEGARFQLPFVNLALVPEAASTLLLPSAVGYLRAAELMLLGEPFSSAKAREYGIVTEVVRGHGNARRRTRRGFEARGQAARIRSAHQDAHETVDGRGGLHANERRDPPFADAEDRRRPRRPFARSSKSARPISRNSIEQRTTAMLVTQYFRKDLYRGKTVFVTGGGSGINLGVAANFAALGANVAICGARRRSSMPRPWSCVRSARRCALSRPTCATSPRCEAAFARSASELGPMDVLVCGAAGNFLVPAEKLSPNGFKTVDRDRSARLVQCIARRLRAAAGRPGARSSTSPPGWRSCRTLSGPRRRRQGRHRHDDEEPRDRMGPLRHSRQQHRAGSRSKEPRA
jgi:enoyl-CoA hydratase/carnithine racemase